MNFKYLWFRVRRIPTAVGITFLSFLVFLHTLGEAILPRFQWYRKRVGGRWERWFMEQGGQQWFKVKLDCTCHRPHYLCRGTPVVENWPTPEERRNRLYRKRPYHFHTNERGILVKCYHATSSLIRDWKFWAGVTLSFPLEHWLWERVWPFYLVTHWLGL
jgi:hypothetical protein